MKKILYIVPILVFAMVALTQNAKAQTGQVGNASNAITQAAVTTVTQAALTATSTGGGGNTGGGTTTGGTVTPGAPVPVQPVVVVGGNTINLRIPSPPTPIFPKLPTFTFVVTTIQIGGMSFSIPRLVVAYL